MTPRMEHTGIQVLIQQVTEVANRPFFSLGAFKVSFFSIMYVLLFLLLLYFISSGLRKLMLKRLTHFPRAIVESVSTLVHYSVLAIGALIIVQSAGVDLSALTVLAGTVGIGIGFGLQNVTNNFISGLIILFERPIKVGDRIEVNDIMGQVMRIGMRSTTVLTNDNVSIIVPNAEFISSNVVNWNHTDDIVRLRIPIGVSYNADPKAVIQVLEAAIKKVPGVLEHRKSDVILDCFGDNSMNFLVRVWTQDFSQRPGMMKHHVNMAIWEALKAAKIEIPYKQLDLHVRSGNLPV